jgi:hypothetical protein
LSHWFDEEGSLNLKPEVLPKEFFFTIVLHIVYNAEQSEARIKIKQKHKKKKTTKKKERGANWTPYVWLLSSLISCCMM